MLLKSFILNYLMEYDYAFFLHCTIERADNMFKRELSLDSLLVWIDSVECAINLVYKYLRGAEQESFQRMCNQYGYLMVKNCSSIEFHEDAYDKMLKFINTWNLKDVIKPEDFDGNQDTVIWIIKNHSKLYLTKDNARNFLNRAYRKHSITAKLAIVQLDFEIKMSGDFVSLIDNAILRNVEYEFFAHACKQLKDYPDQQIKIFSYLVKNYPNEIVTHDLMCKLEYLKLKKEGKTPNEIQDVINKCLEDYKNTIRELNCAEIHGLFLDFLDELEDKNLLHGRKGSYYLDAVDDNIFEELLRKDPHNIDGYIHALRYYWETVDLFKPSLIMQTAYHANYEDPSGMKRLFKLAYKLDPKSYNNLWSYWKDIIWLHKSLRTFYLEEIYRLHGIEAARKLMTTQMLCSNISTDVLETMLRLELEQENPDVTEIRRCYYRLINLDYTNYASRISYLQFEVDNNRSVANITRSNLKSVAFSDLCKLAIRKSAFDSEVPYSRSHPGHRRRAPKRHYDAIDR